MTTVAAIVTDVKLQLNGRPEASSDNVNGNPYCGMLSCKTEELQNCNLLLGDDDALRCIVSTVLYTVEGFKLAMSML